MKDTITTTLRSLAEEHGIKMVHAVESGSRLWGFESPNSDWDVRFIYARPLAWYVSVWPRRDVIEPKSDGILDFSGWDLQKALGLLAKSNPPLLEWLYSPMVYQSTALAEELRALARKYFNPRSSMYHYVHMARGNFRAYLQNDEVRLKKYFYVFRPLLACEFIKLHNAFPPPRWDDMLAGIPHSVLGAGIEADLQRLLEAKKSGDELQTGKRLDACNAWICDRLEAFSSVARTTSKVALDADELNEFLYYGVRGLSGG